MVQMVRMFVLVLVLAVIRQVGQVAVAVEWTVPSFGPVHRADTPTTSGATKETTDSSRMDSARIPDQNPTETSYTPPNQAPPIFLKYLPFFAGGLAFRPLASAFPVLGSSFAQTGNSFLDTSPIDY